MKQGLLWQPIAGLRPSQCGYEVQRTPQKHLAATSRPPLPPPICLRTNTGVGLFLLPSCILGPPASSYTACMCMGRGCTWVWVCCTCTCVCVCVAWWVHVRARTCVCVCVVALHVSAPLPPDLPPSRSCFPSAPLSPARAPPRAPTQLVIPQSPAPTPPSPHTYLQVVDGASALGLIVKPPKLALQGGNFTADIVTALSTTGVAASDLNLGRNGYIAVSVADGSSLQAKAQALQQQGASGGCRAVLGVQLCMHVAVYSIQRHGLTWCASRTCTTGFCRNGDHHVIFSYSYSYYLPGRLLLLITSFIHIVIYHNIILCCEICLVFSA